MRFVDDFTAQVATEVSRPQLTAFTEAALNGMVADRVREHVTLRSRRRQGMFFTGPDLAKRLLGLMDLRPDDAYLDPCCGAGDLLLAIARRLPVAETVEETLRSWGNQLHGWDINPEMPVLARNRLFLLARERVARPQQSPVDLVKLLPNLRHGDALSLPLPKQSGLCVLLNPPYARTKPVVPQAWGAGSLSQAAVITLHVAKAMPAHARLLAILPEVLRCGSRYGAWRSALEGKLAISNIVPAGPFDAHADVDVFLLAATAGIGNAAAPWQPNPATSGSKLSDKFDVRVGSVVPHRDPKNGARLPYLHAANATGKTELKAPAEYAHYECTPVKGPFVAIRRTSSPKDRIRLVSTVIPWRGPVLVENHLIVAKPKKGGVKACRALARQLASQASTDWVNARMRCRHLTVGLVRDLPFA